MVKKARELPPRTTGPIWGVLLGALLLAVGIGLWFYSVSPWDASRSDGALAVAAVLVGGYLSVYAGHEIYRQKRR